MDLKSINNGILMYLSFISICVLIGIVYFVLEPEELAIKQSIPIEVSKDKNQDIDLDRPAANAPTAAATTTTTAAATTTSTAAATTTTTAAATTAAATNTTTTAAATTAAATYTTATATNTTAAATNTTAAATNTTTTTTATTATAATALDINMGPTVENYDGWKIIYDEKELRAEVNSIHNSSYKVREGDKCRKSIPDFILVGVGKCGTRELMDSLSIHPNIIIKSDPYILRQTDRESVIDEMPCKHYDQLSGFKRDDGLYRIPLADEIYKLSPKMKIMAIVREPVSRMISSLTFIPSRQTRKHVKTLKSRNIKTYVKKVINETVYNNNPNDAVKRSIYDVGVARYLKRFKRDQILVIESKEFQTNPVGVLKTVEQFLGISSFISEQHFAFNSKKQFYCIRKTFTVPRTMVCYQANRGRKHIVLDQEDKDKLAGYFRPHNENLFRLIGKRFDW